MPTMFFATYFEWREEQASGFRCQVRAREERSSGH
jgi:hypothetical protein